MLRYIHGEWKYSWIDSKHNVKETYKLFSIEGRENGSLYFLNFYKQIVTDGNGSSFHIPLPRNEKSSSIPAWLRQVFLFKLRDLGFSNSFSKLEQIEALLERREIHEFEKVVL